MTFVPTCGSATGLLRSPRPVLCPPVLLPTRTARTKLKHGPLTSSRHCAFVQTKTRATRLVCTPLSSRILPRGGDWLLPGPPKFPARTTQAFCANSINKLTFRFSDPHPSSEWAPEMASATAGCSLEGGLRGVSLTP